MLTLPHDEVLIWGSCCLGISLSAASSSASPQEQFLQAFLFPVVPQTANNKMSDVCLFIYLVWLQISYEQQILTIIFTNIKQQYKILIHKYV